MRYITVLLVVMAMAWTAQSKMMNYDQKLSEMKKPSIEVVVAQLLGGFKKEDYIHIVGSKAYDIARTGVGCGAGVFGGADTIFTIIDIISQDPTDPGAYIFAVIYTIAWWQQNGQYVTYMCSNFWQLLH